MKNIKEICIGERLRLFREKCGFTQQQIANALCIDRSTYSYYETGKTTPSLETLVSLAGIFHMDLQALLHPMLPEGDPSPPVPQKWNHSPIFALAKDERQLVCYYRRMDPKGRQGMLEFAADAAAQVSFKERNIHEKPNSP